MDQFTSNPIIENILNGYQSILKDDYPIYRNHVYRIYYLALSLDSNPENSDKYAIAASFHDIGIWTHSFDYIAPSIQLATEYLELNNLTDWNEEISLMIDNHHKISVYKGEYDSVEVFRKADWVDVVMGIKMYGISKSVFKSVKKVFPIKGFHCFLIKQTAQYFLKSPLNPLPMFKR